MKSEETRDMMKVENIGTVQEAGWDGLVIWSEENKNTREEG